MQIQILSAISRLPLLFWNHSSFFRYVFDMHSVITRESLVNDR